MYGLLPLLIYTGRAVVALPEYDYSDEYAGFTHTRRNDEPRNEAAVPVFSVDCEEELFNEPVLSRAARCGGPAAIRTLLQKKIYRAQVNTASTYYRQTPLHVAAYSHPNAKGIIPELLNNGASPFSQEDTDRRTPVMLAAYNPDGVSTFKALTRNTPTADINNRLLAIQDNNKRTVWHFVAMHGNIKLARYLVYMYENKTSLDLRDESGLTPLSVAGEHRHRDIMIAYRPYTSDISTREWLYMRTRWWHFLDVMVGSLLLFTAVLIVRYCRVFESCKRTGSKESLLTSSIFSGHRRGHSASGTTGLPTNSTDQSTGGESDV